MLDLANAYLQLPLEEESKQSLTINTHQGLFKYIRLLFDITSFIDILQHTMRDITTGSSEYLPW